LAQQRNRLAQRLKAVSLRAEQIKDIKAFKAEIAQDMETFRQDFEGRRRLIEMLNVQVTLKIEDEQRIVHVECYLGEKSLSIASIMSGGLV
jgi:hypothetical protein